MVKNKLPIFANNMTKFYIMLDRMPEGITPVSKYAES